MANTVPRSLRRESLRVVLQNHPKQIRPSHISVKASSVNSLLQTNQNTTPKTQRTSVQSKSRRCMSSSSIQVKDVLKDKHIAPSTLVQIVNLLNKADIPSILWGNSMLDIYGVPTINIDMSFVIKRGLIEKARQVLLTAGLVECTSSTCHFRAPDYKVSITLPNGRYHFHLAASSSEDSKPEGTVQLHIRDERIWTLPTEDSTTYTDDKIIMASDPRLKPPNWNIPTGNNPNYGKCRHHPGSPVRILTPECYADALVLLQVRDRGTMAGILWSTQITYMIQYKLFDPEKVHPATKRYMLFPTEADRMERAVIALGDNAERGKLFANWAK